MAGKPQNRLELRRQYDAAEPLDPMEDEAEDLIEDVDEEEAERKPKKKKAPARSKAKTTKAAKPAARMRIVWAVVNDAFKTIQTFEYAQRAAAEARAAELTAKKGGTHFVQKVKEPMPDDAPGLGASIPRTPPATASTPKPAIEPVEDEEIEDEDEAEPDLENDNEDEDEDE